MSAVNLALIHEICDGDTAMEHRLFGAFLRSAAECMAGLETNWHDGQDEQWRHHAHAFKGICLNLGANHLGELCKIAQSNYTASSQKKLELLALIQNELQNVEAYLAAK